MFIGAHYNHCARPYDGSGCPWLGGGHSSPGFRGNISDAHTGGGHIGWRGGIFGGFSWRPNEGYALDFNRNGRYDRGRDGVLVFDTNRDGRYDARDVQSTNNMMQAVKGNFDFNNDGRISLAERMQGQALRGQYARLDSNRDGVLSTHEIARGGGRVWVDQNRSGNIQGNELHSAYRLPNSQGWGPSQRLDFVDPFSQTSHTSSNWGWGPGRPCFHPQNVLRPHYPGTHPSVSDAFYPQFRPQPFPYPVPYA
jgi:hypothetical protein